MRFAALLLPVAALAALFLAGCAEDPAPGGQPRVSNIPFNHPEPWESQGPLGGMMPGSR